MYIKIGSVLGVISGFLTFVGCWIYCVSEYGFLLGVGLGWLPSIITAFLVYVAVTFLWGLVAVGVILAIVNSLPSG